MQSFISKSDFQYELPEYRIAFYPLEQRDSSKLLTYQNHKIIDSTFCALTELLPAESILIFNETKVIPARLIFSSDSGMSIEIFCLQRIEERDNSSATWLCYVGNARKWKQQQIQLKKGKEILNAEISGRKEDAFEVIFNWNSEKSFEEILDVFGATPLPPYIKRKAEESDKESYQTIFSKHKGSVAAPTASLHFTENILAQLREKNIQTLHVTLHVGAGTFKPIKSENVLEHKMHEEYFEVSIETILSLTETKSPLIIPVGTTALRTMETLYWLGVKASVGILTLQNGIFFSQFEYRELPQDISFQKSMEALLLFMQSNRIDTIAGNTQIMITPDYIIKSSSAIITNFHQPESTLLLLIAAFVGKSWRTIYEHALSNNYRFLSYGDSSLLFLH